MKLKGGGVIPAQMIWEMIDDGEIKETSRDNIQPASLDLTVTGQIYRMKGTLLPQKEEKIIDIIEKASLYPADISQPLELNGIYLIKLEEELALPSNIYASSNNKSSTGRINLQTRLLTDGGRRFNKIQKGYHGSLWLEVVPKSFLIKLRPGDHLNQIRFCSTNSRISEQELEEIYKEYQLLYDNQGRFIPLDKVWIRDYDGTLIMTVNLNQEIIGYKCSSRNVILDYSRQDFYKAEDFFEPIIGPKSELVLKKGEFYVLSTKEFIRVPPELAVEMMAYDVSSGEFRSHYAGFFDPGFGYGRNGEIKGRPAVLEVCPYDSDFILRDNQPICKMTFEKLTEIPIMTYGESGLNSHYKGQIGPRLSKHFKM